MQIFITRVYVRTTLIRPTLIDFGIDLRFEINNNRVPTSYGHGRFLILPSGSWEMQNKFKFEGNFRFVYEYAYISIGIILEKCGNVN